MTRAARWGASSSTRRRSTPEQRSQLEAVWVERVRLIPRRDRPESVFRPIDTWRLLQNYRARVGRELPAAR